jgi:RNA polymerase sigma factor (sigma-70 family)
MPEPMIHSISQMMQHYLNERRSLLKLFLSKTRCREMAEDLVQDIALRLASLTMEELRRIEQPIAYLYQIGRNLWLDRLRGDSRSAQRDRAWQDTRTDRLYGDSVCTTPDPEAALATRQKAERMEAQLATMPPRRREAFRLHRLEGLSQSEVAARTGQSRSAVEKHVSGATAAMRLALAAD